MKEIQNKSLIYIIENTNDENKRVKSLKALQKDFIQNVEQLSRTKPKL